MNEKKYVEVNDLLQHLPDEPYKGAIRRVLLQAPAADVVEVVRCGDCKHYKNYGKTSLFVNGKNVTCGWCHRRIRYDEELRMLADDFCRYGERRKENG